MRILCTFSGKFGDILWALPTVRQISKNHGVKVDFGIMPSYKALVPFLGFNSYIKSAFSINNWICEGSPFGDQPWQAPVNMLDEYDEVFHLTYRSHPYMPLVDFIAKQQGLILDEPVCPFIETKDYPPYKETYIVYAFNSDYKELKDSFLAILQDKLTKPGMTEPEIRFVDITQSHWIWARYMMKHALAFVGCRSSNYVLAHGIGQKTIITFEPHPHRNNESSMYGSTFSNPHWPETNFPLSYSPEQAAEEASIIIKQKLQEKVYAIA